MDTNLLTAGQFAKLASTTKRTVTWYDQEGILEPYYINDEGYRFYKPEQIIDFQVILLLRQLNFSIDQIKEYLETNSSLKGLFKSKRKDVKEQIESLTRKLQTIDSYYENFEQEGVLVKPEIKNVKGFEIYYLQKEGPYSKIYEYGLELKSYFKKLPSDAVFLAVFEEPEFKPIKSRFKVGVIVDSRMVLKDSSPVQKVKLLDFKALSYVYKGAPSLLSFHWKQIEKFAKNKKLKHNTKLGFVDIEVYKKNGFVKPLDDEKVVTEMLMPLNYSY